MPVRLTLQPRLRDLGGGMQVRRLLPAGEMPSVGPFVFFDHFGPLAVRPQDNHDVRPHPHIGLATVTYLFEGAMMHRDSLGVTQRIEPGAINLMTAGRGIVHSERRPEDLRGRTYTNHGLQLWLALPLDAEETEPAFEHIPAGRIPALELPGATLRVMIGTAFGLSSPVSTFQPTLYLDVDARPGAQIELEATPLERAVYSVDGALEIDGSAVAPHTLAVLEPGVAARIGAAGGARFVLVGGAPPDGPRYVWWNFVSSSKARIEVAKADWRAQRLGDIPGETDWIPLPD